MDHLSPTELAQQRAALVTLHAELLESLDANAASALPVDLDQPIGRITRMDAIQQQQMADGHRRRLETRLLQVRAALASMDNGSYGICNRCEEEITLKRLRARPESPLCLGCQTATEKRS